MGYDDQGWNSSEGCSTCLAIPGRIIAISSEDPESALVEVLGRHRNVDLAFIQDVKIAPGDWVLVHAGVALSTIAEDEALGQLRSLEMLGQTEVIREVCGLRLADGDDTPLPSNQEQTKA